MTHYALANYEFFHFIGTNSLLPHLHCDTHSSRKFAVLHKVASNGTIKIKELFAGTTAFKVSNENSRCYLTKPKQISDHKTEVGICFCITIVGKKVVFPWHSDGKGKTIPTSFGISRQGII